MHDPAAHRVTGSMLANADLPRCGIEIEPPAGQLVLSGSAYVVITTAFCTWICELSSRVRSVGARRPARKT